MTEGPCRPAQRPHEQQPNLNFPLLKLSTPASSLRKAIKHRAKLSPCSMSAALPSGGLCRADTIKQYLSKLISKEEFCKIDSAMRFGIGTRTPVRV